MSDDKRGTKANIQAATAYADTTSATRAEMVLKAAQEIDAESKRVRVAIPIGISAVPPWFQQIQQQQRDMLQLLRYHHSQGKGQELEFEARVGVIEPKTGHFVARVPQEQFERALQQLSANKSWTRTEPWTKHTDRRDETEVRYRYDGHIAEEDECKKLPPLAIMRKRMLYRWTYRVSNDLAFRVSVASETPMVVNAYRRAPHRFLHTRRKTRCRFVEGDAWVCETAFDLTVVEEKDHKLDANAALPPLVVTAKAPSSAATRHFEVECEWLPPPRTSGAPVSLDAVTWTLLYRMSLLCRSLKASSAPANECVDTRLNLTWPIRCWPV